LTGRAIPQLTPSSLLPIGPDIEVTAHPVALFRYSIFEDRPHEAHFPAQQPRAQAPPRLPHPLGDRFGPQDPCQPPFARPQVALGLSQEDAFTIIRRRADFLAANGGARRAMPGFVLLVKKRDDGDPTIRLGITVTKKVGNAVVRNRMKRRFRALGRDLLGSQGIAGADLILIGRAGGIERDYGALRDEFGAALKKLSK
jgi:ribonuclease P protein component